MSLHFLNLERSDLVMLNMKLGRYFRVYRFVQKEPGIPIVCVKI